MSSVVLFTADLHLREDRPVCRRDDYWSAQWEKIAFLRKYQEEHGCPIYDAGDLFDRWKPSPYLLHMAIENLPRLKTVAGNHDLPNGNVQLLNKSGIGVLASAGTVEVGTRTYREEGYTVHMVNFGEESLISELELSKSPVKNVLVLHTTCWQGELPYPGADREGGGEAKRLLKKYSDFDLIVTGHNHQSFVERCRGRILINPGSMMKMTVDQIDHKPSCYLWHVQYNKVKRLEYPVDADSAIDSLHLRSKRESANRIEAFISKLDGSVELGLSFEKNLERFFCRNTVSPEVVEIIKETIAGGG